MVADGLGRVRRILAIRPRALGDVVLVTPALRSLAAGHPNASVDAVTESRYRSLLAGMPEVGEVLTVGRRTGETLALIGEIRRRRYDLVVDFFGNPRTAWITRLSGAPVRAGYELRARRHAYNVVVPRAVLPKTGEREYAADVNLRLAAAVGGRADGRPPMLHVSEHARADGEAVLQRGGIHDPGRTIGLVAAGNWATKTLPLAHVAVIARRLMRSPWQVVLLTGPGEEHVSATLEALVPGLGTLPPCDVTTLTAVIQRLAAVVGTDSGPRHMAAALGVPTWAWFGPTHPDTWTPRGATHGFTWTSLPCRACDRTECPHWVCMPGLDPDRIATDILEHMESHVRSAAAVGLAARA